MGAKPCNWARNTCKLYSVRMLDDVNILLFLCQIRSDCQGNNIVFHA